jgi:hypothetical protein
MLATGAMSRMKLKLRFSGSDCGTMRDTVIFAAFLLLLILAVVLIARFIVS